MIAHRIALRANDHQARTLSRWCEAARLAWNWALGERDRQYRDRNGGRAFIRRRGKWVPVGPEWSADAEAPRENLSRLLTRVRRHARLWWMIEPPARVYRTELRTLDEARERARKSQCRRPVPKRRASSFGLSNQDVRVEARRIYVPKLGWLRLEERLRMERLLPDDLKGRIEDLTTDQLIGLRFASDAELSDLVRRVLDGELTERKAIKQAVKDWRADHQRI